MLPLFSHLNLAVRSLQEDTTFLCLLSLRVRFSCEKRIKSTAINNLVTAATSWRIRERADARQPGLGGQVAFKNQDARLSLPLWSLSSIGLPHPWASPLTYRTLVTADQTATLAWAD